MADKHKWHDVIVAMANGLDVQYEHNGVWHKLTDKGVNPFSYPLWNWRIKPKTIMIGDMEVPEPLRVAPESGTRYWTITLDCSDMFDSICWRGTAFERLRLERGLIHLTKEAAITHAKALIKVSG